MARGFSMSLMEFDNWSDLVDDLHMRGLRCPSSDIIVGRILQIQKNDEDPNWSIVLSLLFWPELENVYLRCHRYASNQEQLWHEVYFHYLETIRNLDLCYYKADFAYVINYTVLNKTHRTYSKIWTDNRLLESLDQRFDELPFFNSVKSTEKLEAQIDDICKLEKLFKRGLINENDMHMLIATVVYNESLKNYTDRNGFDYELIKKRRQRAKKYLNT